MPLESSSRSTTFIADAIAFVVTAQAPLGSMLASGPARRGPSTAAGPSRW